MKSSSARGRAVVRAALAFCPAASAAGGSRGQAAHHRSGARDPGPRVRHPVERSQRRSPAPVDGDEIRRILRPELGRHRSHGVLLSRPRRRGRRSAAPARMRPRLAPPPVGCSSPRPADPAGGCLRPRPLPARRKRTVAERVRASERHCPHTFRCPIPVGARPTGCAAIPGSKRKSCRRCAPRSGVCWRGEPKKPGPARRRPRGMGWGAAAGPVGGPMPARLTGEWVKIWGIISQSHKRPVTTWAA